MQKQALKGPFFNISTYFSPLLAVFLTGENSLMFFRLPSHSYHQVCHAGKNLPHAPPFAYIIPTICLYNEGVPFLPNRPFLAANHCLFVHPQTFHFFPILAKLERIA